RAILSTKASSTSLYARTSDSNGSPIDTLIPGSWLGVAHRYRLDWKANSVDFFIDGALVASHAATISTAMRVIASDLTAGDPALSVDWLQISPITAPGTFESRIFDAGGPANWGAVSWASDEPTGTSLVVSVRTGNTPTPD